MQTWRLLEGFFDGFGDGLVVWGGAGLEAGDGLAFFVEQELTEVPLHIAWEGSSLASKPGVEGMLLWAFDVEFLKEGEADAVFAGAEGLDLFQGSRLLAAEVVAWEAEDDEALVLVFVVEGLKGGVLLGEAALGGDVDDEDNLALVGFEGGVFAVDVLEGDGAEILGCGADGQDGEGEGESG